LEDRYRSNVLSEVFTHTVICSKVEAALQPESETSPVLKEIKPNAPQDPRPGSNPTSESNRRARGIKNVQRKLNRKTKGTSKRVAPEIDYSAMQQYFPPCEGWKPMLTQKWTYKGEIIIGLTMYKSKTGDMGKFVQGGLQCAQATQIACLASQAAEDWSRAALEAYVEAYTVMVVTSASLKMYLWLYRIRRKIYEALMRAIQAKVEIQMARANKGGGGSKLVEIDLVNRVINLLQQVEFKPGTAEIADNCMKLVSQVTTSLQAIATACQEFPECPPMHFRVEGHTAPSKKSKDNGKATSMARAKALVEALCSTEVDGVGSQSENLREILWPAGFGDRIPPKKSGTNPRRVEVHLMTQKETALAVWQSKPDRDRKNRKKPSCPFSATGKKMTGMFNKWKNGSLGKSKDFEKKVAKAAVSLEKKSTFTIANSVTRKTHRADRRHSQIRL